MNLDSFKDWFYNYKWMEFVLACVFTVVVGTIAYNYKLDLLGPFAAIGLIVIGYISKDKIIGAVMGGIGALPIAIAIHLKILGPINFDGENYFLFILLIYVFVFIMGLIVGLIGSIVYTSRQKSIENVKIVGKNSTKKRKNKKK